MTSKLDLKKSSKMLKELYGGYDYKYWYENFPPDLSTAINIVEQDGRFLAQIPMHVCYLLQHPKEQITEALALYWGLRPVTGEFRQEPFSDTVYVWCDWIDP